MLVVFIDSIMKSQLRSPLDVKFTFVDSTEFTVCRKSFFFIFFFFFISVAFVFYILVNNMAAFVYFSKKKKKINDED